MRIRGSWFQMSTPNQTQAAAEGGGETAMNESMSNSM